ncbi:MAG: deoxyribonuclease V [Dehalococcoidia bacterium]|nr:deoxyribonuclease V [Dehalococcoidia bacterium]
MKANPLYEWNVSTAEAKEIQLRLAGQVSRIHAINNPKFVAGVDLSPPDKEGIARGAVVVLRLPELELVEVQTALAKPGFPYVPGLLSFREAPVILAACEKLKLSPDFILVDGQGIAHPRRIGIASHLGLLLNIPSIGCAKSILVGKSEEVGAEVGSWSPLLDKGELIGAALRTRKGVKPVYVSIGHRVDLEAAIHWVLACCGGYRLPEPIRLAHLAAAGKLQVNSKS